MVFGVPADPVADAIGSLDGPVAVIGSARLARALAQRRDDVIAIGASERDLRKLERSPIAATRDELDEPVGAVVGVELAGDDAAARCLRSVRDGGAAVFVERGRREELARRALCAGLMEIEQRVAGRYVITSGRVAHLE